MSKPPEKKTHSALSINAGVVKPSSVTERDINRSPGRKLEIPDARDLFSGIRKGERSKLSRAITLIESSLKAHQETAQDLVALCLPFSGNSIRIGITGVPGVGKSTFIESFGNFLISKGHKVAVLAVDPSSSRSKGSILGDKTRMETLSRSEMAYIRPSPSGGTLGGVARKTRETMILCEAAGFDIILIETVGVGQSETAVRSMVDFFLLLMIAGAGDELQGIKRGIMEMADAIVINKADGDNLQRVSIAMAELTNALHYFHPAESGWSPVVTSCSARNNVGITEVWDLICQFLKVVKETDFFTKNRAQQSLHLMYETIDQALIRHFHQHPETKSWIAKMEKEVQQNKISAYTAAHKLIELYLEKEKPA